MKWEISKYLICHIRQALSIALELFLFIFRRRRISLEAEKCRPIIANIALWILRIYIVLILVIPIYIILNTSQMARSYPDADVAIYATPLIAPTVTTDGGATNILETEARLRGEITDTGNENPDVWVFWGQANGGTNPAAWSDNANLGTLGLGTFYKDISSLTANTTYYYQCRATNAAGTDWAPSSANFTTLPTGSVINAPTGFTVNDLGAITLEFTWTTGTGANYTMIRGARDYYPALITEGELIYYGPAESYNSTGYALDVTEYLFSAWGFWSDNTSHSTDYATASEGGALMSELADAIEGLAGNINMAPFMAMAVMIPLIFFTWLSIKIDSEWGSPILAFITGGLSFILGYNAPDILDGAYNTSAFGLTLAVVLVIYSLICVIWAWSMMFKGRWWK